MDNLHPKNGSGSIRQAFSPGGAREHADLLVAAMLALAAFVLYLRTLAPSVAFLFDDTLEFQYVVPRLGILHQTGYPFYTLLGKLFTLLVPLNDPAFRLNLLSAVDGALAVGMVYLVARHLVAYRIAAAVAALTFAVGQTFWSQAVIAETYTTQMLIVATLFYLVLIWSEEVKRGNVPAARRRFYLLALVMGLGLTHHRLILLLYPAIAVYVLLVDRTVLRAWKFVLRAAVLFLVPLLLYLYLPLRGAVGSADGTYRNTFEGFVAWVMAQEYTVFLTQDPFQVQRDAAYYLTLFQNQFTLPGLVLAALGLVWLFRKAREAILLLLALIIQALFVFNYRVANVYVHFLTTFLIDAVLLGVGIDALFGLAREWQANSGRAGLASAFRVLVAVLVLLIPLTLLPGNYVGNDLSGKWDVHDYGLDILSQSLEANATIIGIQGEITLVRYFQENLGIRPDVQTVVADAEEARLAAVERAVQDRRSVYLTRPLKGLAAKFPLASVGPLIRVQPESTAAPLAIAYPLEVDFGPAVKLLGYNVQQSLNSLPAGQHAENGRRVRVTLYWQAIEKLSHDALVSIKLVAKDDRVGGQIDRRPVLDAFPTTAWQPGTVITDVYDVPVFLGAPPGKYTPTVTLYDSQSGTVIGRTELGQLALAPDVVAPLYALGPDRAAPQHDAWNIDHRVGADFGGFALEGYTLASDAPVRPGDALRLTLLWRAGTARVDNSLVVRVWLEDSEGRSVASRDAPLGSGLPVSLWQPNQYVRDNPVVRVPANLADGRYTVKLAAARNNALLGPPLLPFGTTMVNLGPVLVKNRTRIMTAPEVAFPMEETFGNKIRLVGYDLSHDRTQRGVRLTMYYKSLGVMDNSYAVFVHVLDLKNNVVAAGDSLPGGGNLPTTGWIENEYISDVHAFTLPPDLPSGGYPLEIGFYDPATGVRLKTTDGQDRVILTTINDP